MRRQRFCRLAGRKPRQLARSLQRLSTRSGLLTLCESSGHVIMPRTKRRLGSLLVVEPEALLRWSLATYLSKWFDVFPTDSSETALRILDDHNVDGAVISDQLAPESVPDLTARLQLRNPNATIVYTVTNAETSIAENRATLQIEKPFQLADLAALLGVGVRDHPGGSATRGGIQ